MAQDPDLFTPWLHLWVRALAHVGQASQLHQGVERKPSAIAVVDVETSWYDFCAGRGSKYQAQFLDRWRGTLTCDDYKAYDVIFKREGCVEAGCRAHARCRFDELVKASDR